MPLPRLAHLDAPIDNAGGKTHAAAVDLPARMGGRPVQRSDQAVMHGQRADSIGAGFGVDQAGIGQVQVHAANQMNQMVKAKIKSSATVATMPATRASDFGGFIVSP